MCAHSGCIHIVIGLGKVAGSFNLVVGSQAIETGHYIHRIETGIKHCNGHALAAETMVMQVLAFKLVYLVKCLTIIVHV